MKYLKALAAVIILILLDQFTKYLAVQHLLPLQGGKILIPGVFRLLYLENRGSAFGMLQNKQTFFIIFTIIVLVAILIVYSHMPQTARMLFLRIDLVLIFAGAIGNFIDRIRQGFVVDFLYFELIDFPIFNVADIYVTVGCILLILLLLFYYKDEELNFFKK
ncbi:MAG: signal peptidase II [Solobacterium sp.]|nr:signal peptidase II [Solobacterium sp.]